MTARNGFGSTDHGLPSLIGIQENLTTIEGYLRGAVSCMELHIKGNGMICPAVTMCFTFVKPTVRVLFHFTIVFFSKFHFKKQINVAIFAVLDRFTVTFHKVDQTYSAPCSSRFREAGSP